jgi:hypothetical protein
MTTLICICWRHIVVSMFIFKVVKKNISKVNYSTLFDNVWQVRLKLDKFCENDCRLKFHLILFG